MRIVLSLFDGISCGQVAFERLGITFDGENNKYIASEIKDLLLKPPNYIILTPYRWGMLPNFIMIKQQMPFILAVIGLIINVIWRTQ